MIAGDQSLRSKAGAFPGICHRCMGNGEGFGPCDAKDTTGFPAKMCPGGIRATVTFPTCWDGKNLDSPDHSSHMAYTSSGDRVLARAACPASHPVRVPELMYEINWDTRPFNDAKYFQGGKQPFVYSNGDAYVFILFSPPPSPKSFDYNAATLIRQYPTLTCGYNKYWFWPTR